MSIPGGKPNVTGQRLRRELMQRILSHGLVDVIARLSPTTLSLHLVGAVRNMRQRNIGVGWTTSSPASRLPHAPLMCGAARNLHKRSRTVIAEFTL